MSEIDQAYSAGCYTKVRFRFDGLPQSLCQMCKIRRPYIVTQQIGKLSALCDGTLTRPWEVVESIDPINLLTPSFPPTISLHGDKDSVAPISDSEIFTDTLTELGVETEFLVIPGAEHGLYPDEEYLSYFEKGVAFLERQV